MNLKKLCCKVVKLCLLTENRIFTNDEMVMTQDYCGGASHLRLGRGGSNAYAEIFVLKDDREALPGLYSTKHDPVMPLGSSPARAGWNSTLQP